ncbi:hypothetical protein HC086_003952 [Salmonella enterica subsp. enterica]|uniref:Uncharacterized protein n=4 Tax=Salmonella enterica TaxID=28901 RepID=A0A764XGW8_SALER|nr:MULTISPECIES: hypothetical protein [Salmonella]EAA3556062.1 hypothetical protein [Salmonella enterica subsp. enterica serovar Montevideo]EAB8009299.1 hypothetical protein [Salmonella enterica subsp. enterica serovar Muenchen]EAM1511020.1 hypothetical protein [Salmonella enterica]EBM9901584.1 hypothetical protein [Salmonella enterica subsp. enterica serovar Typhimurium]EBO3570653.1 hypothetical protein [Salmonella enterica subsp. enterica serovar Senftenberg]EBQ9206877.1 hypothetical protei
MYNLKSLFIDIIAVIAIVCLGMVLIAATVKFITCYLFLTRLKVNTLIKNVPIARAGRIVDGREITQSILKHCVETFNPDYYQPNIGEFIGNPMVTRDIKNQGKIERLTLKDGTLFADVEMYMPIADVKKLCPFPAIAYNPKFRALMYVILTEIPNRKDCIALKDCEMREI